MKRTLTIIGLGLATVIGAQAKVLSTGNYPQNFNSFGTSNVTWTNVPSLNYAPTVSVAAGALSGAATTLNATITCLGLADGASVYLRWFGNNGVGTDAGLAIDNVTIIPEPTTWALLTVAGMVFLLRRKVRRKP
jgi:hypothetical protein